MKTMRTLVIIVAVALAAVGLAVLPSVENAPSAQPGITVGGTSDAGGADAAASVLPGDVPEPATSEDGSAVAIPSSAATGGSGSGLPSDVGAAAMRTEPSPAPAPSAAPAPDSAPRADPAPSTSDDSSGPAAGGSSTPGTSTTPAQPSGACGWDDDGWECDDDGDDDDDDDGGDGDDGGGDGGDGDD